MNTRICYLYRDSDNYKVHNMCVIHGELTDSDGRKGILEIKTTEIRRSLDRKKWDGQIPDYYYAQIVHQLLATGYDFAILKARIRERGEYG